MFANKLATAIVVDGQPLREFGDKVYVKFGSEYSIMLKNKSAVRASVKVEIDGIDISDGYSIVIPANSQISLERFIKNGNLTQGNRFKFIERTEDVANHRGVSNKDGLVKISYKFEVMPKAIIGNPRRILSKGYDTLYAASAASASLNGVTAPGSVSDQKFTVVNDFETENVETTITYKLLGEQPETGNSVTISSRATVYCSQCGKPSKSTANFCSGCGASLQIV